MTRRNLNGHSRCGTPRAHPAQATVTYACPQLEEGDAGKASVPRRAPSTPLAFPHRHTPPRTPLADGLLFDPRGRRSTRRTVISTGCGATRVLGGGHGPVLTGASVRQVTVWQKRTMGSYPNYHGKAVRIPAGLSPDAAGGAPPPRVVRYAAATWQVSIQSTVHDLVALGLIDDNPTGVEGARPDAGGAFKRLVDEAFDSSNKAALKGRLAACVYAPVPSTDGDTQVACRVGAMRTRLPRPLLLSSCRRSCCRGRRRRTRMGSSRAS